MGQVKNSSRPLHAGSLKWTAVQPDQAQPFRQGSRQEGVVPSLPRSPAFLEGLPPVGAGYAPREPITRNLQRLIQDHGYAGAFARAISAVSCPNIPELDQIQTLEQFYFLIDAMVTWIPELRVWVGRVRSTMNVPIICASRNFIIILLSLTCWPCKALSIPMPGIPFE